MLTKEEAKAKLRKEMRPLGWALRWSGAMRVHDDGDGVSSVFRPWHPLSWVMWIVLLPVCGILGERISSVVPFRAGKYFRENPDKLQWL